MIRNPAPKPKPSPVPAVSLPEDHAADAGPLVRLGIWGGVAVACLLLVAMSTRTETGQARLSGAYAYLTGNTEAEDRQAHERRRQIEEIRRLSETVRDLDEDRDRLLSRLAALERNYEDVTGSIGKLASAAAAKSAPAPASPPPDPAPVGTIPAAAPPAPVAEVSVAVPPAVEPQPPVAAKAAFGVDVGGGATVSTLRNAWERIRRNHAALLDGLQPVIAVRDGRGGHAELRLIAGPIANAAAAVKLCAALAAAGLSCQPTAYDGQRLVVR
jgi:hypothetical protein